MTFESSAVKAAVLSVRNLSKYYRRPKAWFGGTAKLVRAVDDVSFDIPYSSTLGLVGESGCGKSTIGKTIVKLTQPTSGTIVLDGDDITHVAETRMRAYRHKIQMVFQDPYSSLNPKMTAGEIISEPLIVHNVPERKKRFAELFDLVNLPISSVGKFPHEFSGGQRQRIGIARALALNPKLIVCDEPVSALDVSIQAQIINLLMDLKKDKGISLLFIAHDLAVVKYISDRIAVMYLGKIVEYTSKENIFHSPLHPYTRLLISSIPRPVVNQERKSRHFIAGDLPSPINPPSGCYFRTRCPHAMQICSEVRPALAEAVSGHLVACHLYEGNPAVGQISAPSLSAEASAG